MKKNSFIEGTIIATLSILLLKLIIPTNLDSRLIQMRILAIYGIISFSIYIYKL